LRLREGVGARPQGAERVGPGGVGGGGHVDRGAEVVGAGQRHGDAADAHLGDLLDAVVVQVGVDEPGQAGGQQLAEGVAGPVGPGPWVFREFFFAGGAARGPGGVDAAQVGGRLGVLGNLVGPRVDVERERPGGVRVRRYADRVAAVIGAGHLDVHAVDAQL